MLKRVYVWEFPVRLTHWVNFLSILLLSFTGYYIGNPFIHAISETEYIMGWMRFLHFVSAYAFTVSFFIRIYWLIAGNEYASWRSYNPFSIQKIKELIELSKYYLFLRKEPPHISPGHSACGIYAYLGLFIIFIIQILTGFALYSQSHVGGLWKVLGGWVLLITGEGYIRLIHHIIMWLILVFAIGHVYIGWFLDRQERNGLMSSIFSGFKVKEEK
jgi:Ni/Fe-hydrogenase 1 B-type cytochrome subunit